MLSWSDSETFSLRNDHKVEGSGEGYEIVIAEQWDAASLFDESVIEKQ